MVSSQLVGIKNDDIDKLSPIANVMSNPAASDTFQFKVGEIKAAMAPYLNNNGEPVFLSGDLNIRSRSDRYFSTFLKNGTGMGQLQGFVDGAYTNASFPYSDNNDKGWILDHVLVNPNGAMVNKFKTEIRTNDYAERGWLGDRRYTDHNAVASTVEILKFNGVQGTSMVHRLVQVAKYNSGGTLVDTITPSLRFSNPSASGYITPSTPLGGGVNRFSTATRLNIELHTRIFDPFNGSTPKNLDNLAPQVLGLPNNIGNVVTAFGGRVAIDGGTGNDTLIGGAWSDSLNGFVGDDSLTGGGDDDFLTGGTGRDTFTGGTGDDTFYFDANHFGTDSSHMKIIKDYSIGDRISLGVGLTRQNVILGARGSMAMITFNNINGGSRILLEDFLQDGRTFNDITFADP